ncbi:hypothetical protein VP01_2256g2 [Puccinia sorghi]|uniref:Uncharacterized protein n=1 Tax=Puccinia sorghi TaxID=27349 RepID=A0A0L6V8E9_9BASI|nr:hypothetical protein VP01_2256g2 [Puccinia sorghi]
MSRTLSIVFVGIVLVTLLEYTQAAVVGHHLNPIRKSIQRKTGSVENPSFLLFRRALDVGQDDKTDGPSPPPIQESQYLSEPEADEDSQTLSFMMISTSTFSTADDFPESKPLGDQAVSPGIVSIDMTIIQFSDSPSLETRKVARRFGSQGPLSIERSYSSYVPTSSDSTNEVAFSQAKPLHQNPRTDHDSQPVDSRRFQDLWPTLGGKNNQIAWSIPTAVSPPEKGRQPQDSYQKPSTVASKTKVLNPFTKPIITNRSKPQYSLRQYVPPLATISEL